MHQEIRFCTAPDGARIAYASVGGGPPLVKTANWLNHLEFDWESPVFRHFFRELSSHHRLIRYDERGNGLSDWNVRDFSFEKMLQDLETVVDAAGIDRFALLGISQGCAISVAYAVRHPERVEKLILYGGYAAGWRVRANEEEIRRRQALITLTREGWGTENDAYRQVFTSLYIPDGTPEQIRWFNDLQRITTSPENAALLQEALGDVDVRALLPQVQAPTLVLHARHDAAVPFAAGREVAAGIPGARFVAIESRNHLLLEHDVVWTRFREEVRGFLGVSDPPPAPAGDDAWRRADDLFESLLDRPEEERLRELARPEHEDIRTRVERLLGSVSRAGDGLVTGGGWLPTPGSAPGAPDDPGAMDALPPGFSSGKRVADRYVLEEPIGRGGMGVVFRARDALLARDVAVKVAAGSAASRSFRERVLREARSAAALNHPHVVAIHDVGEAEGLVYLVLELVSGPTLERCPPRGAAQVAAVARQICDALDHAHRRGVVHRDLKPANVMWADGPGEGPVKLADLGIALVRSDPRITGTGHILGTPAYMAPEQALGKTPDARTDLYSLGVMMYEWLTGAPPFEADTPLAVVSQHVHAAPVPPRGRRPDVPEALDRIICRLLEKQPEDRFTSAAELRTALHAADEPLQPTVALRTPARPAGAGQAGAGRTEAYEWYLRGVHHFLRGGAAELEQARQWFQRSLEADEGYASSWAGLSLCSSWVHLYHGGSAAARREAVTAGARAVELNPALGEARTARGLALSLEDRDVEAQEEFERALSLDPKLFEARYLYGRFCYSRGMPERAAALLAEAEGLRPDEMQTPGLLAKALRALGRDEEAAAAFGRALGLAEKRISLDPHDPRALTNGARALVALGRSDEGLEWAERSRKLHPGHPMLYYVACAYAAAGDEGSALDCLEEIVAAGWRDLRWLGADPDLNRMRSDPRFVKLRGE